MKRHLWEEISIAFSIANLLFIGGWRKLLYPTSDSYHIKASPIWIDYASLLILVCIVAIVLLSAFWLARKFNKGVTGALVHWLVFGVILVIANSMRLQFYDYQVSLTLYVGYYTVFVFASVILAIYIGLAFWNRILMIRTIRVLLLVIAPFALVTFSQAFLGIASPKEQMAESILYSDSSLSDKEVKRNKVRVVWIVFDSLEYRTLFENRPSSLKLPEFDRLTDQALSATKAVSPAYRTLNSMPALFTGKTVIAAKPTGKAELSLVFGKENDLKSFSEVPTVFSEVKRLGGKSAVVGWYHPYCRLFFEDLSGCYWEGFDFGNDFVSESLGQSLLRDTRNFVMTLPMGFRVVNSVERRNYEMFGNSYVKRHKNMVNLSRDFVSNLGIDLVLVHFPVPHYPYLYNKEKQSFEGGGNYLDNLVLTDQILGVLRSRMEESGVWENSAVIVSSDHQWRVKSLPIALDSEEIEITGGLEDPRIPFIVKLPNQRDSISYDEPFNTLVTHDLILTIMRDELSDSHALKAWLSENAKYSDQILSE